LPVSTAQPVAAASTLAGLPRLIRATAGIRAIVVGGLQKNIVGIPRIVVAGLAALASTGLITTLTALTTLATWLLTVLPGLVAGLITPTALTGLSVRLCATLSNLVAGLIALPGLITGLVSLAGLSTALPRICLLVIAGALGKLVTRSLTDAGGQLIAASAISGLAILSELLLIRSTGPVAARALSLPVLLVLAIRAVLRARLAILIGGAGLRITLCIGLLGIVAELSAVGGPVKIELPGEVIEFALREGQRGGLVAKDGAGGALDAGAQLGEVLRHAVL
jgi:hypothetical protein